ncbi:hypothetical protein D3C80_2178770 [compost metagenome]
MVIGPPVVTGLFRDLLLKIAPEFCPIVRIVFDHRPGDTLHQVGRLTAALFKKPCPHSHRMGHVHRLGGRHHCG